MCVMAPPMAVCLGVQLTRGMPRSYMTGKAVIFYSLMAKGQRKPGQVCMILTPNPKPGNTVIAFWLLPVRRHLS
jgi:hypothetical protein